MVKVTGIDELDAPISTLPKLYVVGVTSAADCVPVALTIKVNGFSSLSLQGICTVAVCTPVIVGRNSISNVIVPPEARTVVEAGCELTEKSVEPEISTGVPALVKIRSISPVLVIVKVST